MRKIILNLAVSLDGFIEDPNGEYDWCFIDQDHGMTDFMDSTNAIFFGQKKLCTGIKNRADYLGNKKQYVLSKTLPSSINENVIIIKALCNYIIM